MIDVSLQQPFKRNILDRIQAEPITQFPMNRRSFIKSSLVTTIFAAISTSVRGARPPKILLRSSWQTINIGDIAHTPGLLALLERHFPEADVRLWANQLDQGVDTILQNRFPNLKILAGEQDIQKALIECDFFLHGSGANLVAQRHVTRWHEETGKPFGIFGITFGPRRSSSTKPVSQESLEKTIALLNHASFVFFRDKKSLDFAKSMDCQSSVVAFVPDAAFACDLRNDERATAFMAANNLVSGQFLCCIPRLRYSPYWTIPSKNRKLEPDKHARNEEMKEHDHAPLRQAIVDIVTQTNHKVLICPEDQTQMTVGREMLWDRLSDSIRRRVVLRPDFWLTDEAISTFVHSVGLFGNDLHSAIMCIGNGIPAVVCRWAEQTSKGTMWKDIGLDNWLFDLDDDEQVVRVAPTVLDMVQNPSEARKKANQARRFVAQKHTEGIGILRGILSAG